MPDLSPALKLVIMPRPQVNESTNEEDHEDHDAQLRHKAHAPPAAGLRSRSTKTAN